MKANQITRATLGRLPLYLNYLKQIESSGTTSISATTIAKALSLGEVQVRKDLASVSGAGKPKVGYESSDLIKRLEDTLGSNSITSAVLVGAGKLGRVYEPKEQERQAVPTRFQFGKEEQYFENPFLQAQYMYELIESV